MSPPVFDTRQLNRATLARQGLLEPLPDLGAAETVARLGSLQAQHPDWPPFALETRRTGNAAIDLTDARRRRQVVRASLMRMTVHIVAVEDFWPMSTVTLPFRRRQWRLMYKQDPQTSRLGRRIAATHQAVLAAMREQPRGIREIEAIMQSQLGGVTDIPPNRSLWRHFSGALPLVHAPIDRERYGGQRYLPAIDWLGPPSDAASDPEAAAAHVARRYLAAFGPASVEDLVAYVGRSGPIGPWRRAIAALGDEVVRLQDEHGRELFDLVDAPRPPAATPAAPRLLARWDSLLLAYGTGHRTRVLPAAHRSTVITRNADVLPTFLVDGVVAGTWLPRRAADGTTRVELRPFGRLSRDARRALTADAERLLPVLATGAIARYPGSD